MDGEFINQCIQSAYMKQSKCTQKVLNIPGMCGEITRHLYNNLCSLSGCNLLEIGCWKGASTIAALYNNKVNVSVIDNWSEFGSPCFEFNKNISKHLPNYRLQIINENCFRLKTSLQYKSYDIYIYDGSHNIEDHKKAIVTFWEYLSDTCIIIIDDWKWDDVKKGTMQGLDVVNANVIQKWELYDEVDENKNGVWNGCCIFLIKK